MIVLNIVTLLVVGTFAWRVSGYDARLEGDGRRSDLWRRIIRVAITLFLVEVMLLIPPAVIFFAVLLGIIWAGCLSELFSHWFRRLMDPQSTDHRAFDANRSQRCLDAIAHLVRSGRREEAIRLCEEFKKSGEVDAITLDLTLDYLGVKQPSAQIVRPMTEARRLREQGKFPEAEQRLVSLLQKNPADTEAAILLMRIYAQDLRQPARAYEVLRELEKQTHVSASLIDFARASIHEWSQTKPEAIGPAETHHAESVDGLIAQGLYGSAAEILEGQIKIQADEFEPRLKLAELYAVHCKNVRKAEQIVRELQASPQFSQQQREMAATNLRTWRQSLDIHAR